MSALLFTTKSISRDRIIKLINTLIQQADLPAFWCGSHTVLVLFLLYFIKELAVSNVPK